ncbi:MAG: metal ABC transporter substrate-binding protein [Rhizobiales bacterium]|nr:metal ABC transporter substrate-binding protein [Hyphomicrobiales bacterium]
MLHLPTRRLTLALVLACAVNVVPAFAAERIKVVASFSILADLVRQVGGERVSVTTLVGANADAHVYSPSPADAVRVRQADLVVINGLGFEGWADRLVRAVAYEKARLVASQGISALRSGGGIDPHAWQDVANTKRYVANIRDALAEIDPAGRAEYAARATAYSARLDALDGEIRALVAAIPPDRRKAITSHEAFSYFGDAYGIVFHSPQGVSTESEPGAAQVAALIRQIKAESIKAVFIENMSDPRLVTQIAKETGAKLGGRLYSDALSSGGPAGTYVDMMRHNARAIARALQ